jgi:poly-gamma-glutamate capsule biosynthesis protein CapA/YwtB (metallophosphatase superfamily)
VRLAIVYTLLTILIGGDLCPIGGNLPFFTAGHADRLFGDLRQDFKRADLVIANLECPLIEEPTPIAKLGPVFGAPAAAINGIRAAGIGVLGLANNHVLDHGDRGLASTLQICAGAGIATVGAGQNLDAARSILIRQIGELRIGVLAMAEHEFSIATTKTPGANPLDLIDYVRNLTAARDQFDYLIVLLHGGPEFLTAPTPQLKKTCRFLVEMGANAVIVQHPHALGGYEHYLGGHIVYGQGALLMDEAIYRDHESFHDGVLVALTIEAGRSSMELLPFVQSLPAPGARRMIGARAEAFLAQLATKSRALLDDEYISQQWQQFCEEHKHNYLSVLVGHNRLLRVANRYGHLARLLYSRQRLLGTRNVICCESHREALETIFKSGLI